MTKPPPTQDNAGLVEAPFSVEQVVNLNEFQRKGYMHPFTCGGCSQGDRNLVATVRGWVCPYCDYTQNWAHDFMADGSAVKGYEEMWSRLTHPVDTAANADDGLADELDGLLYSIIRMPMSNKGGELVRWRKKASERAQSILTALRAQEKAAA